MSSYDIFKEIPFDHRNVTLYKDSDIDEDYCPSLVNNYVIVESSLAFNYSDCEILNYDKNIPMKDFSHEISKYLVSKTLVRKRASENL